MLASTWDELRNNYSKKTSKKVKLIDLFILFTFCLTIFQILYCGLISHNPFEPILGGIFCTAGISTFTIALRILLLKDNKSSIQKRVIAEYFIACFIIFFASLTYML